MSTYENVLERCTQRARGWCFTINNFSEEEKNKISELIGSDAVKYGIAETEHTGEGEGTPHIQGYIYFDNAQTFNRIKILIGQRAHIEAARGNPVQNFEYCSKENTVFAQKSLPSKGVKTPWLEKFKDLDDLTIEEFEQKYPQFFFFNFERIFKIRAMHKQKLPVIFGGDLKEKNFWLWGKSGVGKSRWAWSQVEPREVYDKLDERWWDNFDPDVHKLVLLDDLCPIPEDSPLNRSIKIWADRKPFSAAIKGAQTSIFPGRFFFVITSQYPPEQIFKRDEDAKAIHRRFTIYEVKEGDLIAQNMKKVNKEILIQ